MIKGLYETHLQVSNLEKAIEFYRDTLELEFALLEEKRRIAFFWVGKSKEYMLGLWEITDQPVATRHFAFRCDEADILERSVKWLKERGLQTWMPAVAIYFNDPDGNVLEFIAILDGNAKPELGVISYDEWVKNKDL